MVSRNSDALNTLYLTQFDALIEVIESWPEFSVYTAKLHRLRPHLVEKLRTVFDVNPNHFNTLIHGDMWINNLMMKLAKHSDENNGDAFDQGVEDTIFVDFQYSCWASPTIDLHFLFNISLHESLRPNSFDKLIEFYHEHLSNFLKCLGYKKHIPTLDEFMQQYLDRILYGKKRTYFLILNYCFSFVIFIKIGFVGACLDQPIVINDKTETADIEALLGDNERSKNYKRLMYSSPRVQANLRKLIPIFDSMGVFNL